MMKILDLDDYPIFFTSLNNAVVLIYNWFQTTYNSEKRKKYEIRFTAKTTLFRRDFQTLNADFGQKSTFTLRSLINVQSVINVQGDKFSKKIKRTGRKRTSISVQG